jgi:hypothetical protein
MGFDLTVGEHASMRHRRSDDRLLDLLSTMADELMNRPVGVFGRVSPGPG